MISLTLLHPLQSTVIQEWLFENESVIKIGRSTNNDVILYSAVVSRHHLEIRRNNSEWEIVNLGANGTYLEGKRAERIPVVDDMIIRLASSGPQIKIQFHSSTSSKTLQSANINPSSSSQLRDKSKDTFIN